MTGTIGESTDALQGRLNITQFANRGGEMLATGTLSIGDIRDKVVSLLVNAATGTCQVLNLELGPLDLDLLGLVVQLDQVMVNITAESNSGKLLGDLVYAAPMFWMAVDRWAPLPGSSTGSLAFSGNV